MVDGSDEDPFKSDSPSWWPVFTFSETVDAPTVPRRRRQLNTGSLDIPQNAVITLFGLDGVSDSCPEMHDPHWTISDCIHQTERGGEATSGTNYDLNCSSSRGSRGSQKGNETSKVVSVTVFKDARALSQERLQKIDTMPICPAPW